MPGTDRGGATGVAATKRPETTARPEQTTMKAVAVFPGQPNSMHLERLPKPSLSEVPAQYPGWLRRLLTHPVRGLETWPLLLDTLTTAKGAIKVYCEVAED